MRLFEVMNGNNVSGDWNKRECMAEVYGKLI